MEKTNNIEGLNLEEVLQIYSWVMREILLVGESSLPEARFKAFRKIVFEKFSTAEKKLRRRSQAV